MPTKNIETSEETFETMFEREKFDVIVHLMGEQKLPTLFGMQQFECKSHIVVTSPRYARTANTLPVAAGYDCDIKEVHVDPYDPADVRERILHALKAFEGQRIGFNLTGGTKLMFVGTYAACEASEGVPFYFEALENEIIWLQGDFERSRVVPITSVDAFFSLCGFRIIAEGRWDGDPGREDRRELTNLLWENAHQITSLNRQLAAYNDYAGVPFNVTGKGVTASLDISRRATVKIGNNSFLFESFPGLATYLSGGWFEEFVYLQLHPLLDQGVIMDLRIGMRIDWPTGAGEGNMGAQEFDAVMTDGYRLILVECKSGQPLTQHYESLQNHVALYGGVTALGILAAIKRPHPSTERKIRESTGVCGFWGQAVLDELPKRALTVRGGTTYGGRVPGRPEQRYSNRQKGGRR